MVASGEGLLWCVFFFNDTATTEIYTLSLHDALPILLFIIGFLVVVGSVIGGYSIHGDMSVLWQPIEFVIIFGGAIGAFLITNSKTVVMGVLKNLSRVLTGP